MMSYYRQHVKTVGKRDKTVPRGGHAAAATGGSPQKKKKPAEFSAGCSFAGGRGGAVPLCNKKIAPLSFRHGGGGTLRRLHRPCHAVGDGFAKRCAADAEPARRVLLAQYRRDPLTGLFRRGRRQGHEGKRGMALYALSYFSGKISSDEAARARQHRRRAIPQLSFGASGAWPLSRLCRKTPPPSALPSCRCGPSAHSLPVMSLCCWNAVSGRQVSTG